MSPVFHTHVSPYRTLHPTHPLLHDFHLVFKTWHHIVPRQTLLQLVDVFAVFGDLRAELLEVQLLKCALGMMG